MKGDENRYLVLGKADVVYDLPKNLQKLILSKDDVVFECRGKCHILSRSRQLGFKI
jgi:hypothetical protein